MDPAIIRTYFQVNGSNYIAYILQWEVLTNINFQKVGLDDSFKPQKIMHWYYSANIL